MVRTSEIEAIYVCTYIHIDISIYIYMCVYIHTQPCTHTALIFGYLGPSWMPSSKPLWGPARTWSGVDSGDPHDSRPLLLLLSCVLNCYSAALAYVICDM